jgi:4-diphosphocytidyl-2-C-methyl-D-erythritol kinase
VKVKSFAKINLGLEIVGKRPDGYHDIRTLFQSISLADEITLVRAADGVLDLAGDDASIPWDERNIIAKAVRLLRERTGTRRGAAIRVEKRIPAGRGLAGGSSNAATVLRALDILWELGFAPDELATLALAAGSDVPYFLHGGLCLGEGRGEALTRLRDLPPLACVLAVPDYEISTAAVYAGVGPSLTSGGKASKIMRFLETGDFGLLENDLETVIFRSHPELDGIKEYFRNQGAHLAMVSGSGSAVYGLFPDRERARAAVASMVGGTAALLAETLPGEEFRAQAGAGV